MRLTTLGEMVHAALNTAKANGYNMALLTDEQIAVDLCDYDVDFEGMDTTLLIPHIQTWRKCPS